MCLNYISHKLYNSIRVASCHRIFILRSRFAIFTSFNSKKRQFFTSSRCCQLIETFPDFMSRMKSENFDYFYQKKKRESSRTCHRQHGRHVYVCARHQLFPNELSQTLAESLLNIFFFLNVNFVIAQITQHSTHRDLGRLVWATRDDSLRANCRLPRDS